MKTKIRVPPPPFFQYLDLNSTLTQLRRILPYNIGENFTGLWIKTVTGRAQDLIPASSSLVNVESTECYGNNAGQ